MKNQYSRRNRSCLSSELNILGKNRPFQLLSGTTRLKKAHLNSLNHISSPYSNLIAVLV